MTEDEARKLVDKHLDIPLNECFAGNRGNAMSREIIMGLKWFLVEQMMKMLTEIRENVINPAKATGNPSPKDDKPNMNLIKEHREITSGGSKPE